MATISANGSKGHHAFDLEVTEVAGSDSIATNSSDVSFTFKIRARTTGYNWSNWKSKISYTININDVEYTGTISSYNGSSTVTLKSGTQTIPHNNDGSKTINISFSVTDTTGQSYTCGNASSSGTLALTTIPRASTIDSITGGTLNQTITISMTRMSNTFINVVKVKYGSYTQTISNNAGDSASATLSINFANQITTNTTATAQVEVTTMNGASQVGDPVYATFTMTVPSSVVPTISSVAKSDTSNLLATYGAYVQGKSTLRIQTTAAGAYSSTITNCLVKLKSGNTQLTSKTGTDVSFANITYTGSITIEVTVTDSRGRTATNTSTISIAAYNNPSISLFTAERLNNDSIVTLKYSAAITNINSANVNSKKFEIYKRQVGTSSWGTAVITYTGSYTFSNNAYTVTCDANYAWEFKLEATDSFNTSSPTTNITDVGTAFELVNYGSNGTSIGFGKVAEKSNSLECDLDFYTSSINKDNSPLNIYGEATVGNIKTKNLFNIDKIGSSSTLTNNNDGTLTVTTYANLIYNDIPLKDIAPQMEAGKQYTLSLTSTSNNKFIYLAGSSSTWLSGTSKTITQNDLNGTIYFYGNANTTNTISNIQIEEGTEVTNYTEYQQVGYVSGSNSNGNYIKFDDGTLIQWNRLELTNVAINNAYGSLYQTMKTINFPIPFVGDIPSCQCSEFHWGTSASWGCVAGASLTTINCRGIDVMSRASGTKTHISWLAIGRWK